MVTLIEIENFFDNYDYLTNEVKLDDCTTITNLKNFVEVNITLLKNNSGNKRFLPYYERLKKAYLIVKKV